MLVGAGSPVAPFWRARVSSKSELRKARRPGVRPAKEIIRLVQRKLNVATKPFTNRALPWVVAVVLVLLSLIALAFIGRSASEASAKADVVQREVVGLKVQEQAIQKRAEEVKQSFSAEQLQSLKSAHELVNRKRFYWSRLFADLEAVLPGSVRVSRIAIRQVRFDGGRMVADLELAVVSNSYSTVTEMMSTMAQQGIFQAELHNQNLQKGRGEAGSEYDLKVQYTPRPGLSTAVEQPARAAVEPMAGGLK
jgi:Tfp pilus assembly protein PilN